ncbi:coiled-coil domain-containing protein 159 [Rhineura floridana]|uniref:coiled-coil domain-containing protein 159 n=1 Tax=Rhineura floridana TaxID=261503 RepID=UPI002AC81559|nr:coiled-coil domain-containing protein 159 [Rhineura floridana]
MDSLEGTMLAAKGPTLMMIAKDEKCRDISPNWYLSRAGSTMSADQVQLEIANMKPPMMIQESPVTLKNELELIKAELHAQTKAFQTLSHSITLLEQESNQQQSRIKELEEEIQFTACSPRGETFDGLMQRRIQEVWKVMAQEVQGLQGSMIEKANSMDNLSQEVLESKKFLWEELEAVQGELRRIHQKLKDQEVDITRNLVSIKKMQVNQMKCTKFLAQLKGRIPDNDSEAVDNKLMSEELNDIWSAVNTLRNSITNCNIWSDKRGSQRMKGWMNRQRRKPNSPDAFFSDSALYQTHSGSEHSS